MSRFNVVPQPHPKPRLLTIRISCRRRIAVRKNVFFALGEILCERFSNLKFQFDIVWVKLNCFNKALKFYQKDLMVFIVSRNVGRVEREG
jgi:hypothetical protein